MDELGPLVYIAVKGIAYVAWCGFGARVHGHRTRLALKAALYGLLRLALGAVLGLLLILFLLNTLAPAIRSGLLLYLAVYVPVRWLEWSFLAVLMDATNRSPTGFILGRSAASRAWRGGGIVISCLADLPMIITMDGLPIGRFMC